MKKFIELVTGNLDEKRAERRRQKRVNALPKDYQFVYKQLMHYICNFGFFDQLGKELLDFFEESALAGRPVLEVIGSDAAAFCDELMRSSCPRKESAGEKLNSEILSYFRKDGKSL
jgi:DNA-binding ferritin-like protein (Dps family)